MIRPYVAIRFEGVLHNMERRYKETESSAVREELAKFISNRPAPAVKDARLRREARHVFVENTPLPTISDMSIGHATDFFNNPEACCGSAGGLPGTPKRLVIV